MTRQEAIENHKKMWNWIADETIKQNRKVFKNEYLRINSYEHMFILHRCFLCEYTQNQCCICPILWGSYDCYSSELSLYRRWRVEKDVIECAKLANEIANLPEREEC